jgi:hypothetical protein
MRCFLKHATAGADPQLIHALKDILSRMTCLLKHRTKPGPGFEDDPQYEIKSDKTEQVAPNKGAALHKIE